MAFIDSIINEMGTLMGRIETLFHTSEPSEPEHSTYNLTSVIQKMGNDVLNGDKIAIFIGRTPDQPVPEEKGWSWFTLDINLMVTETTIIKEGPITTDRHLKINFNDKDEIKKIAHRANKIVVDGSVLKSMDSIWNTLLQLVMVSPDSEIFAQGYRYSDYNLESRDSKFMLEKMTVYVGLDDMKKNRVLKDYSNQRLYDELDSRAETYLKSVCDEVSKKSTSTFPYDDLISFKFKSYWHLKGIKLLKENE